MDTESGGLKKSGSGTLVSPAHCLALSLDPASVVDPECLSQILIFTHPGSRITDPKIAAYL